MSYEIPGMTRSVEAAGDLTASYLRFVKLAGATITAIAATSDAAYGVLQNKPNAAGIAGTVMLSGVTRVKSGKALAAGVAVYIDSVGRATDAVVAGKCVGVTLTACSGADQGVSVDLKPFGAIGA